ncbi:MAG: ComEC/Rec2 family competence protein [Dehalococcoidia bacterium]|nr:ComEC/Rec2 family competence protein [Dehalococcoidia bacterium]
MLAVVLAIAWFAGIASVAAWGAPSWLAGAAIACGIPVVARFTGPRYVLLAVAAATVALAGAARFDGWASQPAPVLVDYAGETVTVSGTIEGLPDQGITVRRYHLDADTIETGDGPRNVSGGVLLTTPQHTELEPGARVTARGEFELAPVFEGFDYRSFLLRRGIAGTMFFPEVRTVAEAPSTAIGPAIERLRGNLEGALQRALPEPEASLAAGITIGRDGTIPEELYEDFRRSGLAHVLAVSGSNIVVITALAFWGLTPLFGRRVALWPAMAMTAGYVVLAGADASILRAGLMAGIFLFGEYLGRQQSGLAALGLTGVILTAWQPSMALDIGFQLSFAATAGLMVFTPWIRYGLEWSLRRAGMLALVPRGVTMVIALSIATTLAIVPLLWINFGAVSVVGPIANVIAEVLFLAVLATGLLCGFAGLGVTGTRVGHRIGGVLSGHGTALDGRSVRPAALRHRGGALKKRTRHGR